MYLSTTKIKSSNLLLLLVALSLTFAACEGPAGPKGDQGQEGPQGAVGPAGEDGSEILAGTGAPDAEAGNIDDYYLNTNTGELYGPKNDSGWGTPISLQGPAGQDGSDGSQIYSGTGAPDASLGVPGDYYLDTSSYDLYGPKTDSGWGTPINLKGTANVIYSSWTTMDSAVRDTTIDGSDMKVGDINAPQINQEILDKGVVNVYMYFLDDVYPLPYTGYAGGVANVVDYLPRLGKLMITRFTFDNSASTGFNSSLEFRYVIIPGGVAAKAKLSKDKLKEMSYQEIKQLFNIKD